MLVRDYAGLLDDMPPLMEPVYVEDVPVDGVAWVRRVCVDRVHIGFYSMSEEDGRPVRIVRVKLIKPISAVIADGSYIHSQIAKLAGRDH